MKKRLVLIGVIFTLSLVVVVLTTKKQPSPPSPAVRPTLAPPAPTGIFVQPASVSFSFSVPPSIPESLPSFSFQNMSLSSAEALAARAASQLGLPATPSSLIRGDSYTKTWERPDEAALTVTRVGERISVTFRRIKTSGNPGPVSPTVAAEKFISLFVPSSEGLSPRPAGISVGSFDGLLILDEPPPTAVSTHYFSFAAGLYPVLTEDLSITPASVVVDNRGVVRFAHIIPLPSSMQAGPSVPLLSASHILANLAAGRGTLLDTYNPQAPDQGEVPKFSSFLIEESRVVYAPKNGKLIPALYITGTGSSSDLSTQKATIFLWLVPEDSL